MPTTIFYVSSRTYDGSPYTSVQLSGGPIFNPSFTTLNVYKGEPSDVTYGILDMTSSVGAIVASQSEFQAVCDAVQSATPTHRVPLVIHFTIPTANHASVSGINPPAGLLAVGAVPAVLMKAREAVAQLAPDASSSLLEEIQKMHETLRRGLLHFGVPGLEPKPLVYPGSKHPGNGTSITHQ